MITDRYHFLGQTGHSLRGATALTRQRQAVLYRADLRRLVGGTTGCWGSLSQECAPAITQDVLDTLGVWCADALIDRWQVPAAGTELLRVSCRLVNDRTAGTCWAADLERRGGPASVAVPWARIRHGPRDRRAGAPPGTGDRRCPAPRNALPRHLDPFFTGYVTIADPYQDSGPTTTTSSSSSS